MLKRCNQVVSALLALAAIAPLASAQDDFLDAERLFAAGLSKHWQLQLPLEKDQRVADVYLVDDALYCTTNDGYLFAVHAETGTLRWLRVVTTGGYRIPKPTHDGRHVVAVTASELVSYDRLTGEPYVRFLFDAPMGSGAASDGTRVFVGGLDRKIYAFMLGFDFPIWRAVTNGPITAAPVVRGENLFFASQDGSVYACRAADKRAVWPQAATTTGRILATPVVTNDGVFVASQDRSLYLFEPLYGGQRWRCRLGSPLYESPLVVGGRAFQPSAFEGIAAIEVGGFIPERSPLWTLKNGRLPLAADERFFYALGRSDELLIADIESGDVRFRVQTNGLTIGVPAPDEVSLYLASADGRLFCARPLSAAVVTAQDVERALYPEATNAPEGPPAPMAGPTPEAAAAANAATGPRDDLVTRQPGPPIGGKSKVTREFGAGGDDNSSGEPQ